MVDQTEQPMEAVSRDDLNRFLSGYGITPHEMTVTPLDGGGGNLVLLLEADGRKLVVRRYERIAVNEVEFELLLARFLTDRGFPTQPVLKRIDGSLWRPLPQKPAALFEYVEGTEPVPGDSETASRLAATIACFHSTTRDLKIPNPRAWTDLSALDQIERLAHNPIRDELWPQLLDDYHEMRHSLKERVLPLDLELPKGIIHHDLHPGNLLIDPQGEVVLLDFDEAQVGWQALDLASLIRYWGMDDTWEHVDLAKVSGLLDIYDSQRPLLNIERELLPEMLLLFFFGDALGFILPALARCPAITECHAYRRFRALKADLARSGALFTLSA